MNKTLNYLRVMCLIGGASLVLTANGAQEATKEMAPVMKDASAEASCMKEECKKEECKTPECEKKCASGECTPCKDEVKTPSQEMPASK